jgi:zinc protease
MKRFGPVMLSLALLALAASGAAAETPRVLTLPNGLRVLLAPDDGAAAVDVAVWYRAGSVWEPAGRSGLTHLMERLMFRGSPKFGPGEYEKRLGAAGMSYNRLLSPDFSCFYATGPSEGLRPVLRLEADRMSGQRLTPANVAAERALIAEARRRQLENPVARGLQQLFEIAFGSHPYAAPVQGRAADAERLTPAACAEYARARYGPGSALLMVAGRFDPDSAEAAIRGSFGAIARRDPPAAPLPASPPAGSRRARVRMATPVPYVIAGWRAPADSESGPEMQLIARLLGTAGTGRLSAELVRKQHLAFASECSYAGRRLASMLYVTATVVPGADSATVERALVEEAEKLSRETVSAEELDAARKAVLIAARLDRQGAHGRGQALGIAEMLDGGWQNDAATLERLSSIRPEDVRKVAERVLVPESRAVVWVSPTSAVVTKGGRP